MRIQRLAVMQLEPLELFVVGLGVLQIERIAHGVLEQKLQIRLVVHPVEQAAAGQKGKPAAALAQIVFQTFHAHGVAPFSSRMERT